LKVSGTDVERMKAYVEKFEEMESTQDHIVQFQYISKGPVCTPLLPFQPRSQALVPNRNEHPN
jgi:hypothetical protein